MQHIFGMAKSSLNPDGAKRQKMELDFLRLVYACRLYPDSKAYLVVTTDKLKSTTAKWAKKYEAVDVVHVEALPPAVLAAHLPYLLREKAGNKAGMAAASATMEYKKDECNANIGKELCEKFLGELIQRSHPTSQHQTAGHPLGISWDYYCEIL